ncbi:unnamed protein product [Miscanthus lutarioriparius]|uniref:Uncharacterized protein n=1 Tax=Miscanthus lutarioriparius TaxID=422564 RepID=A0A811QAH3_9POAL|nr:unnamed protein product [Miscanthus lutarioriparius]
MQVPGGGDRYCHAARGSSPVPQLEEEGQEKDSLEGAHAAPRRRRARAALHVRRRAFAVSWDVSYYLEPSGRSFSVCHSSVGGGCFCEQVHVSMWLALGAVSIAEFLTTLRWCHGSGLGSDSGSDSDSDSDSESVCRHGCHCKH